MIEAVDQSNLPDVLPLVSEYQKFYKAPEVSNQQNSEFFSQFGIDSLLGCQFIYREGDRAVGFATVYFSFSSTIAAKVGVLNDVYVQPNARRKGIAEALINHCRDYAAKQGAVRLQWVTATDNEQAQALYDKMKTKKSTWHFYTYPVDA